jgi:two-component sensor histidine kinase
MLRRELNHRLRNVFPLILTIVKQTANNHPEAAAYRDGLERRLRALAAATKLIDRDETDIVYIEDLIRQELAAFEDGHNIVIGGPLVEIPRGILQDFAILVHELTTNAVKHGALSDLRGSLSVTWALRRDHSGKPSLQFDWIERNGPKVGLVKTPGFGSLVIRESGSILGGTASMNYASEGFQYRLTLAAGAADG